MRQGVGRTGVVEVGGLRELVRRVAEGDSRDDVSSRCWDILGCCGQQGKSMHGNVWWRRSGKRKIMWGGRKPTGNEQVWKLGTG